MVVDDSRVVLAEMKKLLGDSEFEVVSYCRCGADAIEGYAGVKPDVVTMDIVMPGIDGVETTKQLLDKFPDARIVLVSSLTYYADAVDWRAMGAKGFVYKPFSQAELLKGLRGAVGLPVE